MLFFPPGLGNVWAMFGHLAGCMKQRDLWKWFALYTLLPKRRLAMSGARQTDLFAREHQGWEVTSLATTVQEKLGKRTFDSRLNMDSKCFIGGVWASRPPFPPFPMLLATPRLRRCPGHHSSKTPTLRRGEREGERRNEKQTRNPNRPHA